MYIHRILFSHEKGGRPAIHANNTKGPRGHYASDINQKLTTTVGYTCFQNLKMSNL